VVEVGRRAKYLLIGVPAGTLIIHLGMSGSLRVLPAGTRRASTTMWTSSSTPGMVLRFNDPRRFGSIHWQPCRSRPPLAAQRRSASSRCPRSSPVPG
jgi:formamidopyrimidine-DNA glycosylase